MSGPYRTPAPPAEPSPTERVPRGDDLLICVVIAACGLLRVALAITGGEVFHVEATIATMMVVLGAGGAIAGGATSVEPEPELDAGLARR